MAALLIGEVAHRFGIKPSAIRYYESVGLLPAPARRGGRRVYDTDVLDHLTFIRSAQMAGFGIAEIKRLVSGLTPQSNPGERWRSVADEKLAEIDGKIESLQSMKRVLGNLGKCQCPSLAHFAADVWRS
jgi:MerR family redox-sensitive transcriptional activator SoxR